MPAPGNSTPSLRERWQEDDFLLETFPPKSGFCVFLEFRGIGELKSEKCTSNLRCLDPPWPFVALG